MDLFLFECNDLPDSLAIWCFFVIGHIPYLDVPLIWEVLKLIQCTNRFMYQSGTPTIYTVYGCFLKINVRFLREAPRWLRPSVIHFLESFVSMCIVGSVVSISGCLIVNCVFFFNLTYAKT